MKSVKLMLAGIAILLFGGCSILLSGLDLPTWNNGIYQLLGLVCPIIGVVLAILGFFGDD